MAVERLAVQVVYALPNHQHIVDLEVPVGTTLQQAVERSRIRDTVPSLDLHKCSLGVFGELRDAGTLVAAGDRIEIYRPLADDPKVIRRRRAAEQARASSPNSKASRASKD